MTDKEIKELKRLWRKVCALENVAFSAPGGGGDQNFQEVTDGAGNNITTNQAISTNKNGFRAQWTNNASAYAEIGLAFPGAEGHGILTFGHSNGNLQYLSPQQNIANNANTLFLPDVSANRTLVSSVSDGGNILYANAQGNIDIASLLSAGGVDNAPLNNTFTGENAFTGNVKLLTSAAAQFNAKVYLRKDETTSGFTATQYAGIDRVSGSGTHWGDVLVMNDLSATANLSGGTVADFKQLDLEDGGNLQYGYGRETNVRFRGSRSVDFLNGHTLRVDVDGTGNAVVNTVLRAISTDIEINNANCNINGDIQGQHNTINIQRGTINADIQAYLIDFDFSGTPANYTINGDVSAIRMSGDLDGLVVNGVKRFLDYRGTMRSELGGALKAKVLTTDRTTFANLPAITEGVTIGSIATISDASAISYRGIAAGGGSDTALVMWDGTNWIYH